MARRAASPAGIFPLRVVRGKRYLVQANGKPFFLVGDAAWSLIAQLRTDDAARYLADRRRKGFDAVLVNLIEHKFAAHAPADAYGDAPFTKRGDFGTPNPRYFAHVDAVIAQARADGILVLLAPAYLGNEGGDQGWWKEMEANGVAKLRAFGRYLGARYRRFPNILWVEGGDFDPPPGGRKLVDAVADGIRSTDPAALQTFHGSRQTSALAYWQSPPDWLRVNTIYTDDETVVANALAQYRRSTMPFFLVEGTYENEGVAAAGVRQQAYQTVLSGGSGSVMGNNPIWLFANGWQAALDSPGSKSMTAFSALFDSLPWWQLRPDVSHRLLLSRGGSGATVAVAARAADGSFAVVYVPTQRTITLNLSQLRGSSVSARWYDPVSGRWTPVAGSPLSGGGSRSLATPPANDGGDSDYVLVLRSP